MTGSVPKRNPSVFDALSDAFSHMRMKLFPFSFMGWLTLAFVSMLENCGSSSGVPGGPGQVGNPFRGGIRDRSSSIEDPMRLVENGFAWIVAHMFILIGALLVVMLVSLVFMWIRSRMVFVYIDDVSTGRFDLARPWTEHGAHADSFFAMSLIVQGASFILIVLIIAMGTFFLIWGRSHELGGGAIMLGAIPVFFLFVLAIMAAGVLHMVLRDFVAPLQLARDIGAKEAGGVFLRMFSASPGLWIGYAFVKFVIGIAVSIVVFVVGCATCCIGFLPLINQMLFQPILYTERAWSLQLLAQMGDDVASRLMPPSSSSSMMAYESGSDAPTGPIDLSQLDFEKPPEN